MLTGRHLFAAETVSDTIAFVLTRDPDYTALPDAVPAHIRALLARCLERDTKRRLRDIGDAGHDLQLAPPASSVAASAASATPAPSSATASPARRVNWLASGIGLVLLGALVGVSMWRSAWRQSGDRT